MFKIKLFLPKRGPRRPFKWLLLMIPFVNGGFNKPCDDGDDKKGPGDDQHNEDKGTKDDQRTAKNESTRCNNTSSIINQMAVLADSINRASSTAASTKTTSSTPTQANVEIELDGAESFRYLRNLISISSCAENANRRVPPLRRKRASSRLSLLTNDGKPFAPISPVHPKTPCSPRWTTFPPASKQQPPTRPKVRFGPDVSS